MFEDNVNIMEDRVEDKACNSSVLRLGSLFNNITEMVQITKFLKGVFVNNSLYQVYQTFFSKNLNFNMFSTIHVRQKQ